MHDHPQGGADDIKKHKWFSELNFEKIYNREEEAPIKPEVANASDTSNFECVRLSIAPQCLAVVNAIT